jgi:hypothetical protein
MKTIDLTVTFTGRVDDNFARALELAWANSEAVIEIPIKDVSIATPHDKATRADFDFCQPNKLVVRP